MKLPDNVQSIEITLYPLDDLIRTNISVRMSQTGPLDIYNTHDGSVKHETLWGYIEQRIIELCEVKDETAIRQP